MYFKFSKLNFCVLCGLVAAFTWHLSKTPSGVQYVGQRINIACATSVTLGLALKANILDPHGNIIPPGMEGDRVRVFREMTSSTEFSIRLEISALSMEDAGTYTCNGSKSVRASNIFLPKKVANRMVLIVVSSKL